MRNICFAVLLLSASFVLAQESSNNQAEVKNSNGTVTVQGCVSRSSGDYILMKQDPAVTYELQGSRKIKLSNYLGQLVEVAASKSPSMGTSSDSDRRSAAPVTLTVTSIKTIQKECPAR